MTMKRAPFCILLVFLIVMASCLSMAEQVERDMFAVVVVNPIFAFTLDNASIDFGYVEPGKTVELNEAAYYNAIECNSNKGKTWYLKVSVLGDISGPSPFVPLDSFKWTVFRAAGEGTPAEGWQPFTPEQKVAYTSSGRDNTGEDVVIQFKYKLNLPNKAVGGYYRAKLLYTMTDQP